MNLTQSYSLGDGDHPKLVSLLQFWEARRGDRMMPARSDINVIELGPWLGNLILLELIDGGEEYIYRVYGTNLATMIRHDMTNKSTAELDTMARETVKTEYGAVVQHRQPFYTSRRRTVISGQAIVSKLILPLSEDGETVDRILAGVYPLKVDEAAFEAEWLGGLVETEIRLVRAEAV